LTHEVALSALNWIWLLWLL
jgi:hypothetical protein